MTASSASTEEQINHAVGNFREMLVEQRSRLSSSDVFEQVLDQPDFVAEQVGVLCRRIKMMRNIVFIRVTSDGTTGEQWSKRLNAKGHTVGYNEKRVLLSPGFNPTFGVTYTVAIFMGWMFSNADRVTSKIREKATGMNFCTPNAEVACLIREKLSNRDIARMGLYDVVTMHDPIVIADSYGQPENLLGACELGLGFDLHVYDGGSSHHWIPGTGFAFIAAPHFARKITLYIP
jgi:hypothetical protein